MRQVRNQMEKPGRRRLSAECIGRQSWLVQSEPVC